MEFPGYRSRNILRSHEVEPLKTENVRLLTENAELRKMVGLMQENLELRCTLRDHETHVRSLSPPGKACKDVTYKTEDVPAPICRDPKHLQHCRRLAGEIAFQLDRRILAYIFQDQSRLYGFRVSNVEEKILQVTTCPLSNKADEKLRYEMNRRYAEIMSKLKKMNYNQRVHPIFSEYLVNTYGIMKDRPASGNGNSGECTCYCDPKMLRKMVAEAIPNDALNDVYILLTCLVTMAEEDGKPILNW
ncbi:speriolin-like protein [Mixophyes fleayi]|uniref:speriolin-like protein n=1 Tax=Mixophyes fleayi TaxID=3061075 RepID=UPI003F4DAFC1